MAVNLFNVNDTKFLILNSAMLLMLLFSRVKDKQTDIQTNKQINKNHIVILIDICTSRLLILKKLVLTMIHIIKDNSMAILLTTIFVTDFYLVMRLSLAECAPPFDKNLIFIQKRIKKDKCRENLQ